MSVSCWDRFALGELPGFMPEIGTAWLVATFSGEIE
jgi:hypothetical protein